VKKANGWSLVVGLLLIAVSFPIAVLGQSTPGRNAGEQAAWSRVSGIDYAQISPTLVSPPPGKAPVDISGEWEMILFDSASGDWGGRVEFEPGGKSTGRIWYQRVTSTWEAITNVSYSAASGPLSFHRPHGNQDYRVTVKGSSMEGAMVEGGKSYRWTAQKKAQPSPPSPSAPAPAAPTPQPIPPSSVETPPIRCGCGQMVITYAQKQPITIPLDQVASIDWKLMEIDVKAAPHENWGRGASLMLIRLKSGKVQEFELRQPPRIEFICGGEER
jgi:hypothetical protein